ncbi:hypothetical protein OQA88_7875 [Cercophora sp. LCS_1]
MSVTKATTTIPYLIRFVFTIWEPLTAINGCYLTIVDPAHLASTYLTRGTLSYTPASQTLYTQLGGMWLLFAWNEAVIMRVYDDLRLWKLLLVGMLISDALFYQAVAEAAGGWGELLKSEFWILDAFTATVVSPVVPTLLRLGGSSNIPVKMKMAALLAALSGFMIMAFCARETSRSIIRLPWEEKGDAVKIPINTLLYWVTNVFPFDILVKDAGDLTLDAEEALSTSLEIETTRSAGSKCTNVTIVFARGTSEAGNTGILVGPELFDAVTERLGSSSALAVHGVDYAASIPGFLEGGDPSDVTRILGSCPETSLVMAGYSQGGQLVHKAARLLPEDDLGRVSSAVIFGDPAYPAVISGITTSRQLVVCHDTDDICAGGDLIRLSHLTYMTDVGRVADFVVGHIW